MSKGLIVTPERTVASDMQLFKRQKCDLTMRQNVTFLVNDTTDWRVSLKP